MQPDLPIPSHKRGSIRQSLNPTAQRIQNRINLVPWRDACVSLDATTIRIHIQKKKRKKKEEGEDISIDCEKERKKARAHDSSFVRFQYSVIKIWMGMERSDQIR